MSSLANNYIISFMWIISNKQENVLEKILIYYSLSIKCRNVFRY